MFRRLRSDGAGTRWGKASITFPTRLESADRGLHFDARFSYEWRPADENVPLLHPDAVAQTLLRDAAAPVCTRHEIFSCGAAQAAVNSVLAHELCVDPRIVVRGRVSLSITEAAASAARQRHQAIEALRTEEAATTMKLEILRDRLLDRGLGLAWWVDRYADLQFAAGDPEGKAQSIVKAFGVVTDALRADRSSALQDERSMIRARTEELLTALEDPVTAQRAAALLEEIVRTLTPASTRPSQGLTEAPRSR